MVPGIGLCRVGSSHDFPQLLNRIIGFQNHRNDRTFGHELDQTAEKRPLLVNVIKALGLLFAQMQHLHGTDAESRFFKFVDDAAGFAGCNGIGF